MVGGNNETWWEEWVKSKNRDEGAVVACLVVHAYAARTTAASQAHHQKPTASLTEKSNRNHPEREKGVGEERETPRRVDPFGEGVVVGVEVRAVPAAAPASLHDVRAPPATPGAPQATARLLL